ncbi:MAG: MBL fold metallo-hydrolase [Rhizobiales bacterium]|nr:MBL fold metallo-hydrolase [Hyphomicrobiales bacterium]
MTLKLTILGCGSSGGVPRIGNIWGACDPAEPRNRRLRCALLVQRYGERGVTTVLVDATPDLRQQLLTADVATVDGVLITHDHADHTHGLDDLRALAYNAKARVPVYMDAGTSESLTTRFGYCFAAPKGSAYPPILTERRIEAGTPIVIEGNGGKIEVLAFEQQHGDIRSLGFRFGRAAYSSDVSDLPQGSLEALEGLDLWVVDALRYTPHPSHFSLEEALAWIARVQPAKAVITHMHIDLDYGTLCRELPEGVVPAHDGMVLEVSEDVP